MLKLTVCITTFNRWDSCFNTLQSVCNQMQEGLEVILVDDCSSDPMPEKVNNFIYKNHVIYIRHEINQGLASARNTAIKRASGKYFAFCDDDDAWPEGFANRLLNLLDNSPSEVGMGIALSPSRSQSWHKLFSYEYPQLTDLIYKGVTPPVSSQIYKTKILQEIGGYNPAIKSGVDHDSWLSLAKVNPRVAVSWGETAIVGNDPKANRMTTVEDKRRAKITQSLEIWQPKIIEIFGEDFYNHFYYSYQVYLDCSFFVKSLKRGELFQALKKSLSINVLIFLKNKIFQKAMGYSSCHAFPTYKG